MLSQTPEKQGSKVHVAIAGGHVLSEALVVSADGGLVGRLRGPALIRHYPPNREFWRRRFYILFKKIERTLRQHNLLDNVTSVKVSLPGVSREDERDSILGEIGVLFSTCKSIVVFDDTIAYAQLASGDQNILSIIADVGSSVAFVRDRFNYQPAFKIDGWGSIIGDFGSLFELATNYFRRLGRKTDLLQKCPLFSHVAANSFEVCGVRLARQEDCQQWLNTIIQLHPSDWRPHFARVIAPVLRLCDHGTKDERLNARRLVRISAANLCKSIQVATQLLCHKNLTLESIVASGSMFQKSEYFESLIQGFATKNLGIDLLFATRSEVEGVLLFGCGPDERGLVSANLDSE